MSRGTGLTVCIISGGKNEGVRKRLEGLGIKEVILGAHDKVKHYKEFIKKAPLEVVNKFKNKVNDKQKLKNKILNEIKGL